MSLIPQIGCKRAFLICVVWILLRHRSPLCGGWLVVVHSWSPSFSLLATLWPMAPHGISIHDTCGMCGGGLVQWNILQGSFALGEGGPSVVGHTFCCLVDKTGGHLWQNTTTRRSQKGSALREVPLPLQMFSRNIRSGDHVAFFFICTCKPSCIGESHCDLGLKASSCSLELHV